jgi:3-oxoacyl-ACP reductase-like protein
LGDQIKKNEMAEHVADTVNRRGAYKVLVVRPEGKSPLGRSRLRWENNIKMDLQEGGLVGMDWIDQASG